MKKRLFIFIILLQAVVVMAQDDILTVTKPCVIDYRIDYIEGKRKVLKYARVNTTTVKENNGTYDVTYILDYLNKKKQIQKSTNITDGLQTTFTIQEDGSYYLQDIGYGIGKDLVRNGFKLHIPKTVKVGDDVESGRSYGSYKWMYHNIDFDLNYTNFKVVAEEDIKTEAGVFHCFKIEGFISGKTADYPVEDQHAIWISPNIGVVKMEYIMSSKRSMSIIIDSITGL